jgi:hypothetical protein
MYSIQVLIPLWASLAIRLARRNNIPAAMQKAIMIKLTIYQL